MPVGLFRRTLWTCPLAKQGVVSDLNDIFVLRNFCMNYKHCWPLSDAAFCGVWSGSTLFAWKSLKASSVFNQVYNRNYYDSAARGRVVSIHTKRFYDILNAKFSSFLVLGFVVYTCNTISKNSILILVSLRN